MVSQVIATLLSVTVALTGGVAGASPTGGAVLPADAPRHGDRDRDRDRDDDGSLKPRCYQDVDASEAGHGLNADLLVSGPLNTYDNAAHYHSTDGSCSDYVETVITVVAAPTWAQAQAICMSVAGKGNVLNFVEWGYARAHKDWYRCID